MFNEINLTDEQKNEVLAFVGWCISNKKDLLKLATDKDYMKEYFAEYKESVKNEN